MESCDLSLFQISKFNDLELTRLFIERMENFSVDTVDSAYGALDRRDECQKKVRQAIKKIQRRIEFTREYENLGSNEPIWHPLNPILMDLDIPEPLRCQIEASEIEILADPAFAKVFENLLDNTLRHGGGQVSGIRVVCEMSGGDLLITWEDDGNGVPREEKERIFERGYGKNTGLGLFLAQEVLGVTGIGIRENGITGEGARFEIRVPKDGYRGIPGSDGR